MKYQLLNMHLNDLYAGISVVKDMDLDLNKDYEDKECTERLFQRKLNEISREAFFSRPKPMQQEDFDLLYPAFQQTIEITQGSNYGKDIKKRYLEILSDCIEQDNPIIRLNKDIDKYRLELIETQLSQIE